MKNGSIKEIKNRGNMSNQNSYLLSFKKGWSSEHLAKYLLSRFCFVAEPTNVSDDIGIDFYCTTFETIDKKFCQPRNTFGIQIKSKSVGKKIEITKKMRFISNLEIPFYLGIIDKNNGQLTIYSGEAINHFIAMYGIHDNYKVSIKLVKNLEKIDNNLSISYFVESSNNTYYLKFPQIFAVSSEDKDENVQLKVNKFIEINNKIIQATISRRLNQYVFDVIGIPDEHITYSGEGSFKHYKNNFYKSLLEVFSNQIWVLKSGFSLKESEVKFYYGLMTNINKTFVDVPDYLNKRFDTFDQLVQQCDKIQVE